MGTPALESLEFHTAREGQKRVPGAPKRFPTGTEIPASPNLGHQLHSIVLLTVEMRDSAGVNQPFPIYILQESHMDD